MNSTKSYPITVLRVVCVIQVFFIHYLAGHGMQHYDWTCSLAVPSFLLVSAYLYGLRRLPETVFHMDFIKKRYISLSCVMYPFLLVTYLYFVITDPSNTIQYTKSFLVECCYLVDFVTPIPATGHLWFMQTLVMCYIAMFAASHTKKMEQWFTSPMKLMLLLLVVIVCGFFYRGVYLVYIYFYLVVYYNAFKIKSYIRKDNIYIMFTLLFLGYYLLSYRYLDLFHYGIYLTYIQLCIMSIINIIFISILCENIKENTLVNYLGLISMEIYLVHFFIVFHKPLYVSIPVTLFLSTILYYISVFLKKLMTTLLR